MSDWKEDRDIFSPWLFGHIDAVHAAIYSGDTFIANLEANERFKHICEGWLRELANHRKIAEELAEESAETDESEDLTNEHE